MVYGMSVMSTAFQQLVHWRSFQCPQHLLLLGRRQASLAYLTEIRLGYF